MPMNMLRGMGSERKKETQAGPRRGLAVGKKMDGRAGSGQGGRIFPQTAPLARGARDALRQGA
jgi:hypothetical protein